MSGSSTLHTSRITSLGRGRLFSSSSCTCRARSRRSASWSASTDQTNIGSSQPQMCTSASSGETTCTPSRKRFGLRHRNTPRGSWCRLTINGLPGSLSPRPLWKRSRDSTSPTRPSMRRRRRNYKPFVRPSAKRSKKKIVARRTPDMAPFHLPSHCSCATMKKDSLIVVHLGSEHVDGNLGTWRRGSLSSRHDRHDRGPEGNRWLCAAHGARQGCSDTAARLLLGRPHHSPGAIVQRNHHDDDRSRQRGPADVAARIGPRLRCERRDDGYWLAGCTCWRPSLAHRRCAADYLHWCTD